MRRGFTMIELIFVIVIIGILAVIAIPKLNATRDDAKVATSLQNLATCIQDAGSAYTATGKEVFTSSACGNLKCFKVLPGSKNNDGNITVAVTSDAAIAGAQWCKDATTKATARKLVGANGANLVHEFGGNKIIE